MFPTTLAYGICDICSHSSLIYSDKTLANLKWAICRVLIDFDLAFENVPILSHFFFYVISIISLFYCLYESPNLIFSLQLQGFSFQTLPQIEFATYWSQTYFFSHLTYHQDITINKWKNHQSIPCNKHNCHTRSYDSHC